MLADARCHRRQPPIFREWGIAPMSVVHTAGWSSYKGIQGQGYVHAATSLAGEGPAAVAERLPRIHFVASLWKRWLQGTHQGAVSVEHLDCHLDEFTFRGNRQSSRFCDLLFYCLVQQTVEPDPIPYKQIVPRH